MKREDQHRFSANTWAAKSAPMVLSFVEEKGLSPDACENISAIVWHHQLPCFEREAKNHLQFLEVLILLEYYSDIWLHLS